MTITPSYRSNAVWAGVFFIIATALLFAGQALYQPALGDPDPLTATADARTTVTLGVLIEYLSLLAIPLVAVALYPVLRRVSVTLAVGYVAFRVLEAAIFYHQEASRILVLELSAEQAAAPVADTGQLDLLVRTQNAGEAWSGVSSSLYNIAFVIGMLMLNWMLWSSRLVPRWISGWGLVSAVVHGAVAVFVLFGTLPDVVALALVAPLGIQEMVLALWLILKGFNHAALDRLVGAPTERIAVPG